MRVSLWLSILFSISAAEATPLVVYDGLSPDKSLAIAVLSDRPAEGAGLVFTPGENVAYLIDGKTNEIIEPLEDVCTDGGGFGRTRSTADAQWGPDGHFVAVLYRAGRLMHYFELYGIDGRRARRQKLPAPDSIPKGEIYKHLTTTANPSRGVDRWMSPTRLCVADVGLRARDINDPSPGLAEAERGLKLIYEFRGKAWVLTDILSWDERPLAGLPGAPRK